MTTAPYPSAFSLRAVSLALTVGLLTQLTAVFELITDTETLPDSLQSSTTGMLITMVTSVLLTLTVLVKLVVGRHKAIEIINGGHVRLMLTAAVAAITLQVLYVESYANLWVLIYFGTAMAVAALCITVSKPVSRLLPAFLIGTADVIGLSAVILIIGGELSLRVLATIKPSPMFVRSCDSPEQVLAAHQYPAGVMRWGFPTNSLGHYDDEFERIEGKRNILVIGDSFSTGIVPHHHHYTTVAERSISAANLWNQGQPKTGPDGYRLLLQSQGLALAPDAIVISIYIGNDLIESQNIGDPQGLIESSLRRENVLLYLIPERFGRVMEEQARLGDRVIGGNQDENKAEERIREPSELAARFPWTLDPMLEEPTFSTEQYARIEAERVRQNHFAAIDGRHDKLMTAVLAMKKMAASVPFFVMLIPDEYQVDAEVWSLAQAANTDILLDRDQAQRMIVASCKEHDIPCLDLLPVLRAAAPLADGKPHLYHLQNTHLNTRGNRLAGEALGAFLKRELAQ